MHAETLLQKTGGAREELVRRGRGDDNQIDVGRLETGRIERSAGGRLGEIATGLPIGDQMALLDSGALEDPGRRGVDDRFEIGIRQRPGRKVAPGSQDARVNHQAIALYCPLSMCRPTCSPIRLGMFA